jgi:hypothetical protein
MKKVPFYIAGIFFVGLLATGNKSFCSEKKDIRTLPDVKMANKTIDFSGITWQVRNGTGNPGGNNWSDSVSSVWVDSEGVLHMKIIKISGKWYCAEIYANNTVGYGEYKFYVSTNVEKLNKNAVVGLFTYLDDLNEIDIEFSKWGNATQKNMGYYVTQPSRTTGNSENFALNLTGDFSTHRFIWSQNQIKYKSWHGHSPVPNNNLVIHEWNYSGNDIPIPGKELLIINLWLYQGMSPSDGKEVEVLIKAVDVSKPPVVDDLDIVIPENTDVNTTVGTLITPGYAGNELTCSIISGNENGIFSVSETRDIVLKKAIDYESSTSYFLRVAVSKDEMIDTATVSILVTNVNDNVPSVNSLSVLIPEDLPEQSEIGQLNCFDADGDSLMFSIVAGNDNNQYSVNSVGGIILEHRLDYETNTFDSLTIQVSDGQFSINTSVTCHIQNVIELESQMEEMNSETAIYPNPATNLLNINIKDDIAVEIQLISSEGKMLPVKEISRSKRSVQLNIRELKTGNYLVLIKYQNKTEILKFSKVLI